MLAFIFYSQNFHDNSKEWTNGWMSEAISDEKFWQLFLRFETEENTKQISSFYKALLFWRWSNPTDYVQTQ